MNTTIDLKTAKTIEAMNQKINHMDNAVTDFFNKMSDVLELQLGDDEVYAAVIAPEIELTITPLANVRSYLPCFDETDSCYSISEDVPLALCYDEQKEAFQAAGALSALCGDWACSYQSGRGLAAGCGQGTGRQNRIADGYAPGCIFKSAAQPAPI